MSRKQFTGNGKLYFVPTVADESAPTAAEITAGSDITPELGRGTLTTPLDGSTFDTGDADNNYNSTGSGNFGGQPVTFSIFVDSVPGDRVAFPALQRGTTGYLLVSRFGGSGADRALAAGDEVEVWPIDVTTCVISDAPDGAATMASVTCSVPTPPTLDATVA